MREIVRDGIVVNVIFLLIAFRACNQSVRLLRQGFDVDDTLMPHLTRLIDVLDRDYQALQHALTINGDTSSINVDQYKQRLYIVCNMLTRYSLSIKDVHLRQETLDIVNDASLVLLAIA